MPKVAALMRRDGGSIAEGWQCHRGMSGGGDMARVALAVTVAAVVGWQQQGRWERGRDGDNSIGSWH